MNKTFRLTAALAVLLMPGMALAQASCADGKTLEPGVLTIATGNPAYYPWVIDDAPETGQGFEAAVALEVAKRMGFDGDQVKWVRTSFDEAIQPGVKNFDFNLQQFSILPERKQVIDFSLPYYTAGLGLVVRPDVAERLGDEITADEIRGLKFGGASGQTSARFIMDVIQPGPEVLLYDDVADMTAALQANQIEATLYDVPTALFVTAVQYPDGKLIGQFSAGDEAGDQFGLVLTKGNPLLECVDQALSSMTEDGTLAAIEEKWLAENAGIPVLSLDQ